VVEHRLAVRAEDVRVVRQDRVEQDELRSLLRRHVFERGELRVDGVAEARVGGALVEARRRQPGPYLLSHYRRGPAGGFRLGLGHGLYCLGRRWALMLVMFAAGVARLWGMAALTAVMVYEKTGRHGAAVTPVVGVGLLLLSAATLAHPAWLPSPFAA
jgi:hypothetical protein